MRSASCRVIRTLAIPIGADALVSGPQEAGKELLAALELANIRERRCVVCFPSGWTLTASADLPEVSQEDLRGYFELRAEREFSTAASELRLAHSAYTLPDGKRRATLAGVQEKKLEALESMLSVAGCRAVSLSVALEGCLGSDEPALHFVVNEGRVDLIVAARDGIAAMRPIVSSTEVDGISLGREIRITLGRLPEPLRQQVRRARFHGAPEPVRKLLSIIREHLLRMGIDCGESPSASDETETQAGAAIESAERWLLDQSVPFEFFTAEASKWPVALQKMNTARGRKLTLAAVVLVLFLALVFVFRSHQEQSLGDEWDGMKDTVAELDDLQQKIHLYRPWFEPIPCNLHIIDGLDSAFPETGEVWARSVQVNEANKVNCAGFARSQPALMAFLDRLRGRPGVSAVQVQQLRGDKPIQFSVTYKWELKHEESAPRVPS